MHTTQEWHQHASYNVSHAQKSRGRAASQVEDSRKAHGESVVGNLNAYTELQNSLEHKVNNTYGLIEKLARRAGSVESTIQITRKSLAELEVALKAKDSPLQLCVWRMEQRERRPLREQVRDVVEVSLEAERALLVDTQKKLTEAMRKTRAVISTLEEKLESVKHDISQKQQALSVDEMCLRTAHRSYQTVVERTPPNLVETKSSGTSKTSARNPAALHATGKNEVDRQQEAETLSQAVSKREQDAKGICEANVQLVKKCKKAVEEAVTKSERMTQERVKENQHVRSSLEGELRETLAMIDHKKNLITETKSQIKALQEPADLLSTCGAWREQRVTREHIQDPVSTKLREHQMTVRKAHQALDSHQQAEKAHLQDLILRRDQLKDDLKDKTNSLQIDLNCLTREALPAYKYSSKGGKQFSKAGKDVIGMVRPMGDGNSIRMPMTAR